MTKKTFWLIAVAAAIMVASIVLETQRLNAVEAAQVWSAVGTVGAVVVALALALSQWRKDKGEEATRAAAAAVLLSGNAYKLRASLSSIADRAEYLKDNKILFLHWLSSASHHLKNHPSILEDKHLRYAVNLPPMVLFNLTVCHQWLENFRSRFAFADGATLEDVSRKFDAMIDEIVVGDKLLVSSTDQLHPLSQVPGPAPWDAGAPSWARPLEAEGGR
ncbi:hypothetical protein [Pseudoxanthomonas mexicana]|uniref:hypothetical protein n=1 Tax=Pseudoxanthomonas mexicana TaxID=128785 RepID=UPI001FD6E8C8|nr:hypothetical protein [Pseudoxanthomonas mexicana]UOV01635.1 hypothetical protein MUU73_17075 [Pseudoxanthomonas mexicana]